jgi:hypothetical protein
MLRRRFELRWIELTLAIVVAAATATQAVAAVLQLLR